MHDAHTHTSTHAHTHTRVYVDMYTHTAMYAFAAYCSPNLSSLGKFGNLEETMAISRQKWVRAIWLSQGPPRIWMVFFMFMITYYQSKWLWGY